MSHVIRESAAAFPAIFRCKPEVVVGGRGPGSLLKFIARGDLTASVECSVCGESARERVITRKEGSVVLGRTEPRAQHSFPEQPPTGKGKEHPSPPCSSYPPTKDFHHEHVY